MKRLTTVCFLVAALLFSMAPALASPPVFHGDVITPTTPTFNIKAYGAKVDGSTDDSTAVQNAENACNTAGGGRVYFPAGTTRAAGITYYTGCYQVGAGMGVSIVKAPNGANATVFTSYQFATLTGTNSTGGVYHTGFVDITVDGNKANETAGACNQDYGSLLVFENAEFEDCYGDGLYSEWSSNSNGAVDYLQMEASLVNVKAASNGGNGITWKGPHDSTWANVITSTNSGDGVLITGNGMGVLASNFHSWGGAQQWALYIDQGEGSNYFTNSVAEGAAVGQVFFGGNQNGFSGTIYAPQTSSIGAQFGSVGHGVAADFLNASIFSVTGATGALVAFTQDNGANIINLSTYCPTASTPLYSGSYAGSDTITWTTSSCSGTPPNQIAAGGLLNVGSLTASGTVTAGSVTTTGGGTISTTGTVSAGTVASNTVSAASGSSININSNQTTASSGAALVNYNNGATNNNQGLLVYDGGTTNNIHLLPQSGNIFIMTGTGAPTANKAAGSIYIRTDGAAGSRIYISQGGGTWTAIAGV